MRTLVLLPNWPTPSELWIHRMLQAMRSDVAAIATNYAPVTRWQGSIPVHSLAPIVGWLTCRIGAPTLISGFGDRALRDVLRQLRISSVLCHYATCALLFSRVWDASDVPLFVHCHGFDVTPDLRLARWPHLRRFSRGYAESLLRLSRRAMFIANSCSTRDRLEAMGISPERIVVKHLGVPVPSAFRPRGGVAREVSLLYLGRLVDCKGPDLTIQAFDRAARYGLNGTLTLAGDGPLRARCQRLRRRSPFADRIRLPGAVTAEQGQQLRDRADIFTAHNRFGPLTRQEESLGVSILEAMAAGLPVVTGRSGGVTETVVDGETGILVEPGDVDGHATALLQLARDPSSRQRMGEAGWHRVRACFSFEQEAQRLTEILRQGTICTTRPGDSSVRE